MISAALLIAHIGSPDIFFEGDAGGYHVNVTIQPPEVIPGLAEIGVRVDQDADAVRIVALPLDVEGSAFPPTPDSAERSPSDAHYFTGHLWLMSTGSWQVRLAVQGKLGEGKLSLPVPALPVRVQGMQTSLAVVLIMLMLLLSAGSVSIVAAAAREAELPLGAAPTGNGRRAGAVTALLVLVLLYAGDRWWNVNAADYAGQVYKPLALKAHAEDNKLALDIDDPGWLLSRKSDDFVPDHGHLLHLFVVRMPALDQVWHLHPTQVAPGRFEHTLPALDGHYRLFADVVHADGLAETLTTELDAKTAGAPLTGDDSGATAVTGGALADGGRIVWEHGALVAKDAQAFHFRVLDKSGAPAQDLEPYIGMLSHAAIVRDDGSVFVHAHPSGSVPMAALAIAQGGMVHPHTLDFPYAFPRAGHYRMFVQIKRSGAVQTATFDADVSAPEAR